MKQKHPIDREFYPPFSGFPAGALSFLRRLKKNNNRPWFQKHKSEYEELVKFPMQCLISSLGELMASDAPEYEFNPKGSIFRIYRDVRFSRNKSPYKTNIAAAFLMRGKKGVMESPGFYVHIEPGEVFVGAGLYMPSGDQLKSIRRRIADRPDEFLSIIGERGFCRAFGGIQGERLVKAPLGFPKDHPMMEHLRHKQFYVGTLLDEKSSLSTRFLTTISGMFKAAVPFTRWLADCLK